MAILDTQIPPQLIKKRTKTLLEKFTDFVSGFLGSWWAIVFHCAWFTFWLIFNFDLNVLTFSVSLEAIFIGIFLLMSANKAEALRDQREAKQRESDRERLEADIKLDQKADRQLLEIRNLQKELMEDMAAVKKLVQRIEKTLPET